MALASLANGSTTMALAVPLLALVTLEGFYRLVFLFAYGSAYKYSYTPYLFRDHPEYGNGLRPDTDIGKVRHLLFDKYIFRTLPPPVDSLDANIAARYALRVNSRGYRGAEFGREKTQPLRILCSGGSSTACYGDDDQAWPARLGQALAERGMAVEVINGGVWGWTSTQELKRLRHDIDVVNPDVVLLHQGWNEEFLHAVLNLGKDWEPGVVRTLAERELCVAPGSLFARLPFVTTYLLGLSHRARYFERHMAFTNRARWQSLLDVRYVDAWMGNLESFCRLAIDRRFLLYTINPPCLVSMNDERADREVYVRGSRLTPLHADYQAVSRQRISQALQVSSAIVPCLDLDGAFESRRGTERLSLFRDEIHLTPSGDALLAGHVAAALSGDETFRSRYEGRAVTHNIDSHALDDTGWRTRASRVSPYVGRFVNSLIGDLGRNKSAVGTEVPDDMYTTF